MKLQYLGSGASEGWPAIFCSCENCERAKNLGGKNIRTRSQALLNDDLLIDLPPDSYMHMLVNGLEFNKIGHLLVTHSHSDHFYFEELDRCRPLYAGEAGHQMTVYGNDKIAQTIARLHSAAPDLERYCRFKELAMFECVGIGKYTVTALRALHNRRENCLNYLISDGDKTLLYAHDTGIFPEDTWEFLAGHKLDLVSLDCTFQGIEDGKNHMGLPDNIKVKERLEKMGAVGNDTVFVLSHFSHVGGWDHATMEAEASKLGFIVAFDTMTVNV